MKKSVQNSSITKPVAIQGYEGSFHQEAAKMFLGKKTEVYCCANFRDLVRAAADPSLTSAGVMAIENSIAGSILPNYHLLHQSNLKIIGEVYLQIRQQLLVNPGIRVEDIREVHSHPMALLQCIDFLEKYNWRLVETEDTALSAKQLRQHKSKHIAAVASKFAAELFDLEIIAPNIHSDKNNYTRFLVLQPAGNETIPVGANKASISFSTDHQKGSLAKVLNIVADAGINLSKLQSYPKKGSNWNYYFHADLEFEALEDFSKLKKAMTNSTTELKVYGVYVSGLKIKR
jgi:prephenate dehydratase